MYQNKKQNKRKKKQYRNEQLTSLPLKKQKKTQLNKMAFAL